MNQEVIIVGIGADGYDSLTPKAHQKIKEADVLVGSERLLTLFSPFQGEKISLKSKIAEEIARVLSVYQDNKIVFLASGDPGFFGLGALLAKQCKNIEWIPQPTSLQEAFARAGIPWHDAVFCSCHQAIPTELIGLMKRNRKIALLTGPKAQPQDIAQWLIRYGFSACHIIVMENIGMENERFFNGTLENCAAENFAALSVMICLQVEPFYPIVEGLTRPDAAYLHERSLITKRDVRRLCLDRLMLIPKDIVWDIGAGSGALSIEAAERAWRGQVYAFEKENTRCAQIRENQNQFHVPNITVIHGEAPSCFQQAPSPNKVFIGGTGGNLTTILEFLTTVGEKFPPTVMTFAILENLMTALDWIKAHQLQFELLQADFKIAEPIGNGFRFAPQNPIFIISVNGISA